MVEIYGNGGVKGIFLAGAAGAALVYLALVFLFAVDSHLSVEILVFLTVLGGFFYFLGVPYFAEDARNKFRLLTLAGAGMVLIDYAIHFYYGAAETENTLMLAVAGLFSVVGLVTFVAGIAMWGIAVSKRQMQSLKETARVLQESEKTRHEFIDMIAHQLKTPLTPVKGYSEMLQDGAFGKLTPKQQDAIAVIHDSVTQLDDLITKMLHISRLEAGKMSLVKGSVSIGDVVKAVLAETQAFAGAKDITILSEIPESLPQVSANKDALISVLSNLVHNAIKFTPRTGRIAIEAKERAADVLVSVRDNGVGISEERLVHVFDRFHAATPATDGTTIGAGLGLSICKGIINAHGGKVWAESELGTGSIFYFTLPKDGTKAAAQQQEEGGQKREGSEPTSAFG